MTDQTPDRTQGQTQGQAHEHVRAGELAPGETMLYRANPAMLRSHPFRFVLCLLICAAGIALAIMFGKWLLLLTALGLVILGVWWIKTKTVKLMVTEHRTVLRRGLLSRYIDEVQHKQVSNIQVYQTLMQRLFSVGTIGISSSAGKVTGGDSNIEIEIEGIPHPDTIRHIINEHK